MNIVNNVDHFAGKLIKSAAFDCNDWLLCIVFEDDTYAVVTANVFGESFELAVKDDLYYRDKEAFGLITDDDIIAEVKRKEAAKRLYDDRIARSEKETLARLKAKYPNA